MKTAITTAATTAGADQIIYDRKTMQNILLDASNIDDTICLVDEFETSTLSQKANSIQEIFTVKVAFVKQVNFQETAELNDADMLSLKVCCKKFIIALNDSLEFTKIGDVPCRKHQERETDFNAIGWELTLTLTHDGYAEC